jgi:hypothetical protein
LAWQLLTWPIDDPPSLFIDRGAFLDLSRLANETITIHGILVPVSWNTAGEILCVAVSTFDEKEYRVAGDEAAVHLRDYLNREVSIQGRPFQNGVEQWITVQSFHAVQSERHPKHNI